MGKRRFKRPPEGTFTTTIERLTHEGRGIATLNGKTTFIAQALPGETVRFQYTATHGQYDEGLCLEVVENTSTDRAIPLCPHFGTCGGCSLQHMSSEAQVAHKQKTLLELIAHQSRVQPKVVLEPLTAPPYHYRRKARLGIRYVAKKGLPLFGFREINGRFLCDIHRCDILDLSLGHTIQATREMLDKLSIKHQIAQCEASLSEDKKILIFRNLEPFSEEDIKVLEAFGQTHDFMVFQQPGNASTIQGLHGEALPKQYYSLPDFDLKLGFMPHNFTQVNFPINQAMVSRAIDELDLNSDDTVLDLFCGLGNFSLAAARHAKHVTGVEGSQEMAERAGENAKLNAIHNTDFHAFDLIQDFQHTPWCKAYDKLIIDPPRSGAEHIVKHIEHFNAAKIVYISCNPATLARDIAMLVNEKGYTLEKAGVMDMFPHTAHVESMAVFSRQDKS
ncbi:MAG: 23S rRNA (uracil(1939)-C(5))-methyltransferase RlmD [Gammaproteobacteria bacterium CG11_big_fil_rev_8_21_14_0_20_46_22]|nr:MAG: 23S rRNA (uracil(1939)-C(5))-methyltransferase RlmD [Gammaproteobacteria bacterium CG12_big_fil_rev_8_21_14_0_65_46_12]PIR11982.1 MAG: 23S rRNA (uracil(1939)-C(5))-methyltransferase RlmD [Gammaproteobacteria bacterium CG11_big_fil_rev_8_21_14_0_20_46_22]